MQKPAEHRRSCYKHPVRAIALLLSTALLWGSTVSALPPTRDQLLNLFGLYFEALRVQAGIPGMAAALVGDTDIIWNTGFGLQDLGRRISTRADTPFQVDGLTQLMTATLLLRCSEEGRIGLDTPIGWYIASPEPGATVRQILSHSSGASGSATFSYSLGRLELLRPLIPVCFNQSLRQAFKSVLLGRLGMADSAPGFDAASPTLPPEDLAIPSEVDLYRRIFARLAVPYAVTPQGGITGSHYGVTTLSPGTGLISTVRDFAKFDLALRQGILLRGDSLIAAWTPPIGSNGSLPHGMGWFVQSYRGELVVWQFGFDTNASSSLIMTLPARGITLILLANSDGLAKPATLVAGDVTVSPFARVFLGLVLR